MSTAATTTLPVERPGKPVLRVVARNTAFMLGAQVLIKVLSFVFSVYVVRRLGAADFGRYSAATAYAFIFAMLTELGTSGLSVREMARKAENIAWMVPNIIILRTVLSVVVIAGTTASARILGKTPDVVLGIFIASLGLLLFAFQGPFDAVMIARERLDFSSAFNLLNQIVFVVLGTVALLTGTGYIGLLVASLAGILAMGLASGYVAKWVLKLHFERPDPRRWRPLVQASLPFGVIGVISEFSQRFDSVFMSFVLTYAAVGWYNVPYNLIFMMLLIAQSLALSIYPTMVKQYDSGRGSIQDTVQRSVRYLLLISLPIALGGMLLADRVILVLYGSKYSPAIPAMQVMVWALPSMFLAEILGRACITMHLEKKAAAIVVTTALVTVTLDVLLIPRWGVIGAAIVMVISRLVSVAQDLVILGPGLVFKGNVWPLLRVLAAGALMGGVVWLLRDVVPMAAFNDKMALLLMIGAGAVVYGLAALGLRAVSPGEARYILDAARSRLRRSA